MFDCCLCCPGLKYSRAMSYKQEFNRLRDTVYSRDNTEGIEKAKTAFKQAVKYLKQATDSIRDIR